MTRVIRARNKDGVVFAECHAADWLVKRLIAEWTLQLPDLDITVENK